MTDMDTSEKEHLEECISKAEKCPYHGILPEVFGPSRLPEQCRHSSELMLEDAMLFPKIEWVCFCPECAKKSPTPEKHNRFGYGYTSQYSWNAAVSNWNKACMRSYKRLVKEDLTKLV